MDTNTTPPPPTKEDLCSGVCAQCLKGGFPIPKTLLSFFSLACLSIAVVLFVLLVQAKRDGLKTTPTAQTVVATPWPSAKTRSYSIQNTIALPKPSLIGGMSVEQTLHERRSRRTFSDKSVTMQELSQLLWSAQGFTDPTGKRTAPSARSVYPITVFAFVKNVTGLTPGFYEYLPGTNSLGKTAVTDPKALDNTGVEATVLPAPVTFFLMADYGKGYQMLKDGAREGAILEVGHIGENMYLETESLHMATVVTEGFDAVKLQAALQYDPALHPVYVVPFGHIGVAPSPTPTAKPL